MDHKKTGALIRTLRLEKGMTQQAMAEQLHVSARAVSKWETGAGFADVSSLEALSRILEIGVNELLRGHREENDTAGGNMKRSQYYICPTCGSITLSTGSAAVSCCGRPLAPQTPRKAEPGQKLRVEPVEDEWFITSSHPMTKACYISFLAYATGEKLELIKTYPEWDLHARFPRRGHGMLLWYSTRETDCCISCYDAQNPPRRCHRAAAGRISFAVYSAQWAQEASRNSFGSYAMPFLS